MKLRNSILTLSLITLLSLTSCNTSSSSSSNENVDDTITLRDTYENKFGEDKIPNQWEDYGVGDPFVYRFNGRYYLYVSTKNYETGIRGWVSDDLINWECLTGEGLETGYVSNDPCTVSAYAPEVIYYNGYFYMAQSQGGNGHYILRSEKPEGPFVAMTGNFGESIDGSFFLDDNEQLYFLRASNTGIRLIKVNDDFTMGESRTLDNTQIGGWTEGPYLLKRNGIYYLTYTGNHVTSEGYRIGYSYATGELFSRSAFTQGDTIILNTDADFKGLGHSSTVLGPDLDSYYIAYHNLNSSGGPNRSFNISRLSFDGTEMIVNHPELYDNFVPRQADFVAKSEEELVKENDFYLSDATSKEIFTSEYNFIGNNVKAVLSYVDENNYSYVNVNNNTISVNSVVEGKENNKTSVTLTKQYDFSKLHTLRVEYKNQNLNVYFDNMCKISNFDISLTGGKIGYIDTGIDYQFTAFSNVSQNSSSNEEVHQEKILAANYFDSNFKDKNSGLKELTIQEDTDVDAFNVKEKSHDVSLASKGDYVRYKTWVKDDDFYGLDMFFDKKYAGKKVQIQFDDNDIYRVTLPESGDLYEQYVKLTILETELTAGAHYLKVICDGDEIAFHSLEIFKSSKTYPLFENDLSSYLMTGVNYVNSWKLRDNGHYALSGNRNLMYFGNGTFTDFTMEVDIELVGETQANSCGVILRADNPAFSSVDNMSSIQGYYCGFNNSKAFITKCDYNNSNIDISADAVSLSSDEIHHLKVVVRGNHITLDIDNGATKLSYYDANGFTHGNVGLYTDGAASIFRNVKLYY